jgi:hypothetical protein
MGLIKKLRQAKKEAGPGAKPDMVKTHLRDMIIVPEMIGSVVGVYVSVIAGCTGRARRKLAGGTRSLPTWSMFEYGFSGDFPAPHEAALDAERSRQARNGRWRPVLTVRTESRSPPLRSSPR